MALKLAVTDSAVNRITNKGKLFAALDSRISLSIDERIEKKFHNRGWAGIFFSFAQALFPRMHMMIMPTH
ncbi:hypothetical protein J2T20_001957 [Paenibacillus wynnii]|nr:hypothetical protein [Paenibacillus wynnii]